MANPTDKWQFDGVIRSDEIYLLAKFKQRVSFGDNAVRAARRKKENPLRVLRLNGRAFVKGADFIAYLEAHGEDYSNR